jgi:hypothetical protein
VRYRWLAVVAAAPLLVGCTLPPQETPAEALARRQLSCTEAGFQKDTPDFRLCVLLQQTNERLDSVERRLGWIESDVRFPPPYARWPYWW